MKFNVLLGDVFSLSYPGIVIFMQSLQQPKKRIQYGILSGDELIYLNYIDFSV